MSGAEESLRNQRTPDQENLLYASNSQLYLHITFIWRSIRSETGFGHLNNIIKKWKKMKTSL